MEINQSQAYGFGQDLIINKWVLISKTPLNAVKQNHLDEVIFDFLLFYFFTLAWLYLFCISE